MYMLTENNNNNNDNSNNNNNNNSTQTQTLKGGFVSPLVRVCIYSLHLFCIDWYIKDSGETNVFCFALQNRTIVDKQPPLFELQMLLEYYKSKEWEPFTDLYL